MGWSSTKLSPFSEPTRHIAWYVTEATKDVQPPVTFLLRKSAHRRLSIVQCCRNHLSPLTQCKPLPRVGQEVTNKTPFASPPAPRLSKTIPAHQCGGRTTVQVDAPPETRVQRPSEFAEMRHHLTQAEQRCTVRHPRCICVALLPLKCALQIIWRASCSRFHVLYWQKQV